MKRMILPVCAFATLLMLVTLLVRPAHANGDLRKVHHIIVVMQEDHTFDNYFGVLPYAAGTPYHPGPCVKGDHRCVDGLSCQRNSITRDYSCCNVNRDDDGSKALAFHSTDYCVNTDLDHSWFGSHRESNFFFPNLGLVSSPNDGFVLQNDLTNQPDIGESATDDETMSFYNEGDLGFYYSLAQTFAIDDRYFASVLGPTFPNRSYLMAATSFGYLNSDEASPFPMSMNPSLVYQPITGTIFDLLDAAKVSWADYFGDVPQGATFRDFIADPIHFRFYNSGL